MAYCGMQRKNEQSMFGTKLWKNEQSMFGTKLFAKIRIMPSLDD